MTKAREIADDRCATFERWNGTNIEELRRFLDSFKDFSEEVWLGGERELNANEVPPQELAEAMKLVVEAQKLLKQADHKVAMWRALGSVETTTVEECSSQRGTQIRICADATCPKCGELIPKGSLAMYHRRDKATSKHDEIRHETCN